MTSIIWEPLRKVNCSVHPRIGDPFGRGLTAVNFFEYDLEMRINTQEWDDCTKYCGYWWASVQTYPEGLWGRNTLCVADNSDSHQGMLSCSFGTNIGTSYSCIIASLLSIMCLSSKDQRKGPSPSLRIPPVALMRLDVEARDSRSEDICRAS